MADQPSPGNSWFRSRGGNRFGIELAVVVVLKLIALTLIWFVCFRPQPNPDVRPAAIASHLLGAPAETTHD